MKREKIIQGLRETRQRPTSTQLRSTEGNNNDSFVDDEGQSMKKDLSNAAIANMKNPIMKFGNTNEAKKASDDTQLLKKFGKMAEVANQPYKRIGTTESNRNPLGMPMMQKAHSQNPKAAIATSGLNLGNNNSFIGIDKSIGGLTEVVEAQP